MYKLIILTVLLSSCASQTIPFNKVYNLYGCNEQKHDKHSYYGDFKCDRLGEYPTLEECNKNLIKGISYTKAVCLGVYK